ncbi:MAG: hypothetical protein LC798_16215 [Chloroflexi bacterium]|nr:hypothetical protein [Chloroflexota bacterium]
MIGSMAVAGGSGRATYTYRAPLGDHSLCIFLQIALDAIAINVSGGVSTDEDDPPRNLYRGGSDTDTNFTPRPIIDTTGWPNNGLSLFDNIAEACSNNKVQVLDGPGLLTVPDLLVVPDATRPSHYFLAADSQERHDQWAATREGTLSGGPADPLTTAVKTKITLPDVPC